MNRIAYSVTSGKKKEDIIQLEEGQKRDMIIRPLFEVDESHCNEYTLRHRSLKDTSN